MSEFIKPVFLFADSMTLFWKKDGEQLFIAQIPEQFAEEKPDPGMIRAAYIGAANNDDPAFFEIFQQALCQVDIRHCRMIPSNPNPEEIQFLNSAHVIMLAGGDVWTGWSVISETFQDILISRYHHGAILMGVSAGAVHLGMRGWKKTADGEYSLFSALQVVPAIIDAHDQENEWNRLALAVMESGAFTRGFGIPFGGALIYYPDYSFEAIRMPVTEFSLIEDHFHRSLIIPGKNPLKNQSTPEGKKNSK